MSPVHHNNRPPCVSRTALPVPAWRWGGGGGSGGAPVVGVTAAVACWDVVAATVAIIVVGLAAGRADGAGLVMIRHRE